MAKSKENAVHVQPAHVCREYTMDFKIKCREIQVKMSLQGLFDSFELKICQEGIETQEHVE